MSYKSFSHFYDDFTADVQYAERSDYMLALFEKFDRKPTLLLDVGCGTGGFSYEFAKRGIEVIGADISEEMLEIAAAKEIECPVKPIFLNQAAENLDLFGTVDGAVCCLDSINHITDTKTLQKAFDKISLFLEPKRLFIFDVNTVYKHKKVLSGKKFVYDNGEKLCIWKNSFCRPDNSIKMKLKLFENTKDGYIMYKDSHFERAYKPEKLAEMLERAGFAVLAVLGDMSYDAPKPCEERIYFVAEKVR